MDYIGIMIAYPWLAIGLAIGLFWLWASRKQRIVLVSAVMWILYGIYEYLISARILCSGECNIRIDLVLIYPILIVSTAVAVVSSVVTKKIDVA